MGVTIEKLQLNLRGWSVQGFRIAPRGDSTPKVSALWAHGYTSSKNSLLNWALRCAEVGVENILFDLPGHYLGSFNEVESFEEFKSSSHKLFAKAFQKLQNQTPDHFILGGHSLGGLLAIKALNLDTFKNLSKEAIAVGLGMAPKNKLHLFDTPFYKSTLEVRAQLVSPSIDPQSIFTWIKEEKENLSLQNQKITLITGADDLVVGKDGTERLAELLKEKTNDVTVQRPTKLPHHQPEMAAPHIKSLIKKLLEIL